MSANALRVSRACSVLTKMLERSRKFRGRSVFGFDPERRLGHDSLEVLEVGVVAQNLKNSCGTAVADLRGRGEDAPQEIRARLVQYGETLRVRRPYGGSRVMQCQVDDLLHDRFALAAAGRSRSLLDDERRRVVHELLEHVGREGHLAAQCVEYRLAIASFGKSPQQRFRRDVESPAAARALEVDALVEL